MERSKEEVARDVEETTAEVQHALREAGEVWSGKNAVASVWRSTKGSYFRAQDKVIDAARVTDDQIRSNIYSSIGIAFAVGTIVGFFATRKPQRKTKNRQNNYGNPSRPA